VVLGVGLDEMEDFPSPKLNKSEKSISFPFPLFFGGLLFLRVVPVDCERVIGSGRSIRRDFISEVSLAEEVVFFTLLAIAAVRRGQGKA
jgi:hypothetical protein